MASSAPWIRPYVSVLFNGQIHSARRFPRMKSYANPFNNVQTHGRRRPQYSPSLRVHGECSIGRLLYVIFARNTDAARRSILKRNIFSTKKTSATCNSTSLRLMSREPLNDSFITNLYLIVKIVSAVSCAASVPQCSVSIGSEF